MITSAFFENENLVASAMIISTLSRSLRFDLACSAIDLLISTA
jgi:hypothetical protein